MLLKTTIYTNLRCKWVLGFVILRERAVMLVKKWLILENLAIWTFLVLEKVLFWCFWVPREMNSRFCGKTVTDVSVGVFLQFSINLGKKFPRISSIRKIAVTWILARVFAYLQFFFSHILDFIYWKVLIFILIYSEWRGTENQQLGGAVTQSRRPGSSPGRFYCIEVLCTALYSYSVHKFTSREEYQQAVRVT